MKKALTIVLVALMMLSTSAVALADNTTVLTTTVPAATYTLNVPADQVIDFGTEEFNLSTPTITDESGFAEGKNIRVAFSYSAFTCPDVSTTIPYNLTYKGNYNDEYAFATDVIYFMGRSDGTVDRACVSNADGKPISSSYIQHFIVNINSTAWGKALGGDYSTTITFTAEIVAG